MSILNQIKKINSTKTNDTKTNNNNIPELYKGSIIFLDDEPDLLSTKGEYPFEYYNPVQSSFYPHKNEDCNFIVCAATSAGKTVIAELSRDNKGKFLYLSPLKAITEERKDEWSSDSHPWGTLTTSILTGDYILNSDKVNMLRNSDIITLTSEMLDSRTRRIDSEKNDWLYDISVLVIDEFHLIGYAGRGDKLESAIMRFTKINPKAKIVVLSATMSNLSEIGNWISSLNGKKTYILNSNYRPIELRKEYVQYNSKGRYQEVESQKGTVVWRLLQNHRNDKVIIFVHSKKTGNTFKDTLRSRGVNCEFHNGDIELSKRKDIEARFRDSNGLMVLISTSTLAWGVNTPADVVILYGLHRGLDLINNMDITQMIGRAGRIGNSKNKFGMAYILIPDQNTQQFIDYCESKVDVKSKISDIDTLCFHVCSEINSGDINNKNEFIKWYSRSLSSAMGYVIDNANVNELVNRLIEIKSIKTSNDSIILQKLGKISAYMYYSPFVINSLYKCFNYLKYNGIPINDYTFSWALTNNSEFYSYPNKAVDKLTTEYKNNIDKYGLNHTQSSHLWGYSVYLLLTGQKSISFFEMLKRNFQFNSDRLFSVVEMIQNMTGSWGVSVPQYQLRIKYGVSSKLIDLVTIPGIGKIRANKLYRLGIKNKSDFVSKKSIANSVLGKNLTQKILQEI